jgi:hypothetical protein
VTEFIAGKSSGERVAALRYLYSDLLQRLSLHDPRARRRSKTAPLKVDKLILMVGLKRSGLHAVANWLVGLSHPAVLINNSPLKRLGFSSPMSRTLTTSPLPVRLYAGHPALCIDDDGQEKLTVLSGSEKLMIVLFQSQSLQHLAQHTMIEGVHARKTQVLLQLRDPFNWSASYRAKSREAEDDLHWPPLWREYASEFTGKTKYFPAARHLNYNRWLQDRSYRESIAQSLSLPFNDNHRNVVTDHAGGSSFEATLFQRRGSEMRLTERWRHFREDRTYLAALEANPDIVELGAQLFDLPAELKLFARARLPNL